MKKQTNLKNRQPGNIKIWKYTFEDWLNDRINYKLPGGQNILEASNGLATLYGEKLLTKQDYEKIKNAQLTAYDRAVELTVEYYIWHFSESYNSSPYKDKAEYLNNEIKITQERTDKNLNEKNHVLAGKKDYTTIKGSEYQKIMKDKNFNDNGKYSYSAYAYNDNMRITGCYQYLQWLKDFEKQDSKATNKETENSLLHFSRNNANQRTFDNILQKCKDELTGTNFDKQSYAALYLIIYKRYRNIFKDRTSFTDIQKICDRYFSQDTGQYKPGKVKSKAEDLKKRYQWIDKL